MVMTNRQRMDPLYAYHAGWLTQPAAPTASPTKLVHPSLASESERSKDSATIVFDISSFLPKLQTQHKQQQLAVQDQKAVGSLDLVHSSATLTHRIPTSNKHTTIILQSQLLASYRCLDYLLCIGLQRQLMVRGRRWSTHCMLLRGSSPGISLGVSHQHSIAADDTKLQAKLNSSAALLLTPDGAAADLTCKLSNEQYGSLQLTERLQPYKRQSRVVSVVSGAHSVTLPNYNRPLHLAWSCALPSSRAGISHASCGIQLPFPSISPTEPSQQLVTPQPIETRTLPIHHAFIHMDYLATPSTPIISCSYGIGIGNVQHQLQIGVLLSTSGVGLTVAYNTLHSRVALPVLLSNEPSSRAVLAAALLIPSICYTTLKLLYAPLRRRHQLKQRALYYTEQHERWQQHHNIALLYQQSMTHRRQTHQSRYADNDRLTIVAATYGRHWTASRMPADSTISLPSPMDVTIPCQYFVDEQSHTLHFSNRSKAYLPGFAPVEPLSPDVQRHISKLPAVELHITYKYRGVTHMKVFSDVDKVQLP